MTPAVLLPIKPFAEAKSRLAPLLDGPARARLCRDLMRHTLAVLRDCSAVAEVVVISRDPAAWDVAGDFGCEAAVEPPDGGLNAALAGGVEIAVRHGADAVLVLPADLPLLAPDDVAALMAAADGPGPTMVIAPDEARDGTNALLLGLPAPFAFRFGPGSFAAHCTAAREAGIVPVIVERPWLAFDLDTPADYARLPAGFGSAA